MQADARRFFLLVSAAPPGSQRRKDRPPGLEHPQKARALPAKSKQPAHRECLQLPKRATECLYFPARPPIKRIGIVKRGDAARVCGYYKGWCGGEIWRECRTLNWTRHPPRCARSTKRH